MPVVLGMKRFQSILVDCGWILERHRAGFATYRTFSEHFGGFRSLIVPDLQRIECFRSILIDFGGSSFRICCEINAF